MEFNRVGPLQIDRQVAASEDAGLQYNLPEEWTFDGPSVIDGVEGVGQAWGAQAAGVGQAWGAQAAGTDSGWDAVVGCACSVGSFFQEDDYPPSARPDHLKPYAHVKGSIPSAPTDLPERTTRLWNVLDGMGWRVSVRSVGTDFPLSFFGIPQPKDQTIDVLMYKKTGPFSESDAEKALEAALKSINAGYSRLAAWKGEIWREVVLPTIEKAKDEVQKKASIAVPVVVGAALLALGVVGYAYAKAH